MGQELGKGLARHCLFGASHVVAVRLVLELEQLGAGHVLLSLWQAHSLSMWSLHVG